MTLEVFFFLIHDYLSDDGHHIFSIPNMEAMIKQGFANTVNFEHPFYLNEILVDKLLDISGFKILKKNIIRKITQYFMLQKKIIPKKIFLIIKNFIEKCSYKTIKFFLTFIHCGEKI